MSNTINEMDAFCNKPFTIGNDTYIINNGKDGDYSIAKLVPCSLKLALATHIATAIEVTQIGIKYTGFCLTEPVMGILPFSLFNQKS